MAFPILGTPKPQFFDASAGFNAGGYLYIYDPTTDEPKATYPTSDDANAQTNPNDNPITLNQYGQPPAGLWGLDNEKYKYVVHNSSGATLETGTDIQRNPIYSQITVDEEQSPSTATNFTNQFDGDLSKSYRQLDVTYTVGDNDPMGAEGTTYVYRPEIIPLFSQLRVNSDVGHNSEVDQNGPGRTGAVLQRNKVSHNGQGDAVCYNASAFVDSQLSGGTSFLAQPAVVCYNGDMQAGANYTYLNCMEFRLNGSTYDCSGIGVVFNLERNQDRAAQSTYWAGTRIQSQGTSEIDDFAHYSGLAKCGVNLTQIDSPTHEAAIAIKQSDRIYMDASSTGQYGTAFGATYLTYNGTSYIIHVDGNSTLQVGSSQVITNGVHIEAPVTTLADSGTPSVAAGNLFVTGGTTTITELTGGSVGQTIKIRAAGNIVLQNGVSIELQGGVDYSMTSGDTIELTRFVAGVWTEMNRSVN